MGHFQISQLAVPGVSLLVAFLAYSSQVLFRYIEPHALDGRQAVIFNVLVACIWICYLRACFTDPGQLPAHLHKLDAAPQEEAVRRWCKKCEAPKPPRAHHCKQCGRYSSGESACWFRPLADQLLCRCIPRMDHHCPWTINCVSHTTLPHFIRFLTYAVSAISYLAYLLYIRVEVLWSNRNLPSASPSVDPLFARQASSHRLMGVYAGEQYLGPSPVQLIHLLLLCLTNGLTLFALSILLIRTVWSLTLNTTTIEGWEIERHAALVRRARVQGGYAYGPDGVKVRITRQEFPYDVGLWKNVRQGMGGSSNVSLAWRNWGRAVADGIYAAKQVLSWFWPFATTPSVESGLAFEVNGFEGTSTVKEAVSSYSSHPSDPSLPWPPVDPERMPRKMPPTDASCYHHTPPLRRLISSASGTSSSAP